MLAGTSRVLSTSFDVSLDVTGLTSNFEQKASYEEANVGVIYCCSKVNFNLSLKNSFKRITCILMAFVFEFRKYTV